MITLSRFGKTSNKVIKKCFFITLLLKLKKEKGELISMKSIEELAKELSTDELKQAIKEIIELRESGILADNGIVRKLRQDFISQGEGINYPLHLMEVPILFEFSLRHLDK